MPALLANPWPSGKNVLRPVEVLLIVVAFVTVTVFSFSIQHVVVSFADCPPGGGEIQLAVATSISKHEPISGDAPYVYRLGTPALVAWLFPNRLLDGFRIVNMAAAAIGVLLLDVWLAVHVSSWKIRTALVVAFLLLWHAPTRFVHYYPAYTDPWLLVFLLAGLLCIDRYARSRSDFWFALLTTVAFLGVFFKEVVVVVGVAALFAENPLPGGRSAKAAARRGGIRWRLAAPLCASIAAWLIVRSIAHQTNAFSFGGTVVDQLYDKRLLTYVHAWFIAFGPIVALLLFDWRGSVDVLNAYQWQAAYLGCIALLAWVGGSETERILSWGTPVVLSLIGMTIARHAAVFRSDWLILTTVAAQLIFGRAFWAIPSPSWAVASLDLHAPRMVVVYALLDRLFVIGDFHWNLWSYFGSRPFHLASLLLQLLFSAVVLTWLGARRARLRGAH